MISSVEHIAGINSKISTDNLRHIFNAFNFGILVENSDRIIINANKRFLDIFGIPGNPEILEGLYCPDTAAQAKVFFRDQDKFLNDIYTIPLLKKAQEEVIEAADGRCFLRKYVPIIEDEVVVHHIWTYEDVSLLMDKQKELKTQQAFYSTVLNEIPADIAIFSPEHRYLFVNKMGIKNPEIREWIIGKDDYEYCAYRGFPKEIADQRRAKFNQAKSSRTSVQWVDEIQDRLTGKTNYILRIFYPYINEQDELELVIGYGININYQKENEMRLVKQKERMQRLVGTLNEGVFQLAFDGKVVFYNDAFLRIMNIGSEVIPEEYSAEIMRSVHPQDIDSLYVAYERLKETCEPFEGDFRIVDAHGNIKSYINYLIWHASIPDFGDTVIGRLQDVTTHVVHEQKMQTIIEKEKELNNLKSHFIHITSHELRTPLAVILSSAEILDMGMKPENYERTQSIDMTGFTTGIIREVNRITEILNEMMVVGKIEKGNMKFRAEPTNIRNYIQTIADELYSPYSDGRVLQIDIADDVEDITIDAALMRHAIVNLVNNAFKFSTGKQAPLLRVISTINSICIQVQDYGIGIPKNEINMLFNSFFRASNVGNISGTGIGLMVVDHVMKLHNGSVDVMGGHGTGAMFTLSIPRNNQ